MLCTPTWKPDDRDDAATIAASYHIDHGLASARACASSCTSIAPASEMPYMKMLVVPQQIPFHDLDRIDHQGMAIYGSQEGIFSSRPCTDTRSSSPMQGVVNLLSLSAATTISATRQAVITIINEKFVVSSSHPIWLHHRLPWTIPSRTCPRCPTTSG